MYGYFYERNYKGELPYTDLALERRRADVTLPGVEYSREKIGEICCERVKISTKIGAESIGRPIGIYDTLSTSRLDSLDCHQKEDTTEELSRMLCRLFDDSEIFPGRLLIVGLGNRRLTPDSLGCESAARVRPTMHIKNRERGVFDSLACAEIAVTTPGVGSESGLDAAVTVKGICDLLHPDAVIAIDALAARDSDRLGSTIQISNTGISPGSGIGNHSLALCSEMVGAPVIAIGIPTVIDTRILTEDNNRKSMFVSPKEIGDIISSGAEIIAGAINLAFGIYP